MAQQPFVGAAIDPNFWQNFRGGQYGAGRAPGLVGNYRNQFGNTARGLINQGAQAGAFGPDYLRNALRSRAIADYGSRQRRAQVLSQLAGLDPMSARQGLLDSEIAGSGDLSRSLNEADLAGLSGYQQWLRSLFGGQLGNEQQMNADRYAASQQGGGLGDVLGGLLGRAGGSLLGRIGL